MAACLEELKNRPGFVPVEENESRWRLRRKDVAWAIRCAKLSAPGPVGLTAEHWRALGPLAENILYKAAADLERSEAAEDIQAAYWEEEANDNTFNRSAFCCVPKREGDVQAPLGQVREPGQTIIPLGVDVSSRIMAEAVKKRWEGLLGD